jgi:hypothetical protein
LAGANPQHAVENFVRPLRLALSCLTDKRIDHEGGYDLGSDYVLMLNRGDAVHLRDRDDRRQYDLRITQNYRIIEAEGDRGPYKVTTTAYMYAIGHAGGHEIFGYHWHPHTGIRFPHLHLEHGANVGLHALHRAHFPTGRTSLEDFLEFAIDTFRLNTRRPRWRATLQESREAFRTWQTWT